MKVDVVERNSMSQNAKVQKLLHCCTKYVLVNTLAETCFYKDDLMV